MVSGTFVVGILCVLIDCLREDVWVRVGFYMCSTEQSQGCPNPDT